jgi:hypothetical protein
VIEKIIQKMFPEIICMLDGGEKETWGWEGKLLTLLALGPNHKAH